MFIGRTDAEAEAPIRWPPDGKSDLLEKTLMLGKIEGRRRRGRQRMRWLDGITNSIHLLQGIFPTQGSNPDLLHWRQIVYHVKHQHYGVSSKLRELVMDREAWQDAVHGITESDTTE